ncbi:zinc finger FYVE domain-containing protein 9 isoform X2 [Halyomorpha halys]|uniref:zinc finger FYVE domain-containing protein 9 isoform X2 n=1 Tax=Halyomorpha halys TaxID=286706 RepID=UPI000D0C8613|nr:zinc finger FYVE domain-containing protein 16 isoform X2 [Halyomorpha halys]
MDKFAVDIEKVLDEFEYNEGREESVTPVVIKNHSLSRITQKPLRPPAASYRRPTFEPINLADADFAAANFSPSQSYNTSIKQSTFKETRKRNGNHVDNKQTIHHSSKYQDEIDPTDSTKQELKDSTIDDSAEVNRQSLDNLHSEDKPDLLDSNILKPSQIHINGDDETLDANSQLPDITSVKSTVSENPYEIEPVCDLIKPHISVSVSDNTYEEELPPLVDVGSVIKEEIPDLHVRPISFDTIDDISEGELEDYLSNLEVDINDSDDGDSSVTDTKVDDTCENGNENASSSRVLDDDNSIAVTEDTESEEIESNMGLTGSSNKNEKTGISNELDSSQKIESGERTNSEQLSKIESEKVSLLQEFPPETSYGSKKCELDNINCRSCTNNVTSSSVNLSEEDNITSEPQEQVEKVCEESILEHTNNTLPDMLNTEPKPSDQVVSTETQVPLTNNLNEFQNSGVESRTIPENIEESTVPLDDVSNIPEVTANMPSSGQIYESDSNSLEENKPARPSSLTISTNVGIDSEESPTPTNTAGNNINSPLDRLGKYPPFWVPDTETDNCMQCHNKFTVIRRRHHCRACGLVLCSKCCNLKAPLEYMEFMEARVCQPCFNIIYRVSLEDDRYNLGRQPNPNNPMEYCSTIPPLQQAASSMNQPPPSVLVPTGVLKREGKSKSDVPKQVIFSDGIRPGGDLTELDGSSESSRIVPRKGTRRLASPSVYAKSSGKVTRRSMDPNTQSFISSDSGYPPIASNENGEFVFHEDVPEVSNEPVKFAINYNLFVIVKKVKLECCVNRECWSACSEGLACVGQDEVAIILECLPDEVFPPQDIFHLINTLHLEASKGTTVTEMSYTPAFSNDLLGSKDHGGFIYIRPTFQCTTNLLLPVQPYLIAILVHRWETPWARLFPLRLVLRLGAEYRYYPCPLVSIRNRPPLYTDIGHTVMKILVDFRKYSYSLPTVRGLLIHMEDRQTTILFPRNRYDQVIRAINNSNESVLAFGANLSLIADSHLVCIQGTKDENIYHTQAINIHNKPRRVTGASFVVFNGTLKTAGLSGKSSIMEDGLMVHLPSDSMVSLRNSLREMKDYKISCGPNDEETVVLQWTTDDINFNIGVKSCIDGRPLDGVPSIRVHNGTDHPGSSKIIRWTEVFILQTEEDSKATDPIDISRVSESLARATCIALVPELDSLSKLNLSTIAVRANIHPDNVSYEAGGLFSKLPSHYMNLLDEELVPVIHQAAISSQDTPAILELVFRIMNHP